MKQKGNVYLKVFVPTLLITAFTILCMILYPEKSAELVSKMFRVLTYDFGWVFLTFFVASVIFAFWLAFSKHGQLTFGGEASEKDYSEFSWGAMLFTSGLGVGIVLMAFVEPIAFLSNPPFHIEPMSDLAYEYSHMYSQFLWGFPGWIAYTPSIVAVAYFLYNKKINVLRLSAVIEPVVKEKGMKIAGPLTDIIVTIGIVGGISTSLGLGVPTLSGILSEITGEPESLKMTVILLAVWMIAFAVTMYLGLDKGIKKVSNANMILFAVFALVVALKSPFLKIVNLETNSIGLMVDNIGKLLLSTDSITQSGFPQNWTVFYWAWMISFLPMMALFVGRISRGRTIRKTVLGTGLWGGLGCMMSFALFGGYALYLQHSGTIDLSEIYNTQGRNALIVSIIKTLPLSNVMMVVYAVLLFLFLATTVNSGVFSIASVCTKQMSGEEEPARWHRMLWAVILVMLALAMTVVGKLEVVQTASLLFAFPLVFVLIFVMISIKRALDAK